MAWSVERGSCGNSEKELESGSCDTAVRVPPAAGNPSAAKTEKNANAGIIFLLRLRHMKCEFQRVTHFGITCALTLHLPGLAVTNL